MPGERRLKVGRHVENGGCARRTRPLPLVYARPQIVAFGDLRDLTLGGSPGVGESGNPTVFRP